MNPSNRPIERIVKPETAPAAGADWILRPNKGGGWLIRSLCFVLSTSGVAGNRVPQLFASTGEAIWFATSAQTALSINADGTYCAFGGANAHAASIGVFGIDWPTDGLWLPQGNRLECATLAIDAADQYDQIFARVVEYPSGSDQDLWPFGPGVPLPPQ
jgi:hypothetical protein